MVDETSKSPISSLSPLKKNIIANFAGSIWQSIMGLVFIPLYIKFIGIESYGLIGLFSTLQVVFGLLDVGLGSTLTREMARLSALPYKEQEMRDLVRTLELIYWGIAVFVGIAVMSLSPYIAHHWIKAGNLPTKTIEQSFLIMGFAMAFQMPIGFYSGGLMGLQKQILLNFMNATISTLRGIGAVLILWVVSPTIQAFLLWQIAISIISTFLFALCLWRSLPYSKNKAIFQKQVLIGIWKFSAGMSGISILSVILTQIDKIILSRILSLEIYGYYILASVVAMNLGRLFTPVFFSIYPRFTQLVSVNDYDELKQLYHKCCQLIAVLVIPTAVVIGLFSYEIILLWTQNPITAEKTHFIVSIMICGTALNGLMNPPYALQLAFGWTELSILKNIVAVILIVPVIIYASMAYGAIGASIVWLLLNVGYILFEIPIMHRRLLSKEKWSWYWYDVFVPLITALTVSGLGRLFFTDKISQAIILINLIIILILTFGATSFFTPTIRSILLCYFREFKMKSVMRKYPQ